MNREQYCKFLINGLSFHQKNVRFCTTLQMGPVISEYKETPEDLAKKIINLRKNIQNNIIDNKIPTECENCIYRKQENYNTNKITQIYLYYWYHCNCSCFYCSYRDETKGEYSDKKKEGNNKIYKTLKELYKYNQVDKENLIVNFGGGELGVLKEFPKLIDFFLKNNVQHIWFESSGISYSKAVEKVLKNGKGVITVAVCSGSPEIYKKIKRRDKYKKVMDNLRRYVIAASKYKNDIFNIYNVVSKYIILKGFNDNKEEVEKWLLESKRIGLKQVEISMEFCWGIQTKAGQKIEEYNYELFDFAEKKCTELGLKLNKNLTSLDLMKKGVY